jgi:hypothetical protein
MHALFVGVIYISFFLSILIYVYIHTHSTLMKDTKMESNKKKAATVEEIEEDFM